MTDSQDEARRAFEQWQQNTLRWPKDGESLAWQAGVRWATKREREACRVAVIHEVRQGRTINNFGHLPEVIRALEWIWMDLQRLFEERAKRARGKETP